MMTIMIELVDGYFLWRDPVIVAAVCGAVCGLFGVHIVLKRMVFISAALTQVSSCGVVMVFFLQSLFVNNLVDFLDPFQFSILITVLVAFLFSLKRNFHPVSMEGITGFTFLIFSSLVIILSDKIAQGSHEINNILFGSAVTVYPSEVILIPLLSGMGLIISIVFFKDFIFVSYDPETAKLYKYPVKAINLILFTTLAVILAVSTRALGSITVFSLLILPALSALYLSRSIKNIFFISSILGSLSAVFGYFFSYIFSLPTGATMTFTASIVLIISFFINWVKRS